ncbi:LAFE_0G07096g1_1 [Lachancea fermentati]|uniref:ATPase expression protein 2, mitochondrial n=1 Tax=Lachancea fermentati TaxID=4955 RepID=A0A1G4MHL8_LACFM|nr:LAFE_0G07096g1_1 [Lachancea fermentati]
MLAKKRGAYGLVLKGFQSTLSIGRTSASISYPVSNEVSRDVNLTADPPLSSRNDLSGRLSDRYESYLPKLYQKSERKYISELSNATAIQKRLATKEHLKFLIEFVLRCKTDSAYIVETFPKEFSVGDYSAFINGLISDKDALNQLDNLFPGICGPDIMFHLFEVYRTFLVNVHLNPLHLHDLNRFIEYFINSAQLSKAQEILQLILDRNEGELPCDIATAIHFLELRCGALIGNWRFTPANSKLSKKLGSRSQHFKAANSYKAFDQKVIAKLVKSLNNSNSLWAQKRNCELDSSLLYALTYMGQLNLLKEHIEGTWMLSSTTSANEIPANLYPTSDLMIAILSCYASKRQFSTALELLDKFIVTFPALELNTLFWRRLFQWSTMLWNKKSDPNATVSRDCWKVFIDWHIQKGKKIPYDSGLLGERYYVLRNTNDYMGAMDAFKRCLGQLYVKQNTMPGELRIIEKFQKLILKKMASLGYYNKPLQFIQEWTLDEKNTLYMKEYFYLHRRRYKERVEKHKKRLDRQLQQKQRAYDEDDEDDMIIGRLW